MRGIEFLKAIPFTKRGSSLAVGSFIVFFALFVVGAAAIAVESPTTGEPQVGALRQAQTEGDAELAKKVATAVDNAYFRIYNHAQNFTAEYDVFEGENLKGTLTVSWDPKTIKQWPKVESKTAAGGTLGRGVENLAEAAFWSTLLASSGMNKPAAAEVEEGYRLENLDPGKNFKSVVYFYTKDYRLLRGELVGEDGSKLTRTYETIQNEAGLLISSMTFAGEHPYDTFYTFKSRWGFTYEAREGLPFLTKIEIKEVRGKYMPKTTSYTLALKNAKITKLAAQQLQKGQVTGQGPDWDELTVQVVLGLTQKNLGTAALVSLVKSARSFVDISIPLGAWGMFTATLSYSWEDANDDGRIDDSELSIETVNSSNQQTAALFLPKIIEALKQDVRLDALKTLAGLKVRTTQTGTGYVMNVTGKGTIKDQVIDVSSDFRMTGVTISGFGGATTKRTYTHVDFGGKFLVKEMTEETSDAHSRTTLNWVFEYGEYQGLPVISQINVVTTISSIAGTQQIPQTYTWRDWSIVKREKPIE
jgi:hypothetical protein